MSDETTKLIADSRAGDAAAASKLMPIVYDELRKLARRYMAGGQRGSATMQPTVVVHEAYMRLVKGAPEGFDGRTHFFAVAATAMRQILIDHARGKGRAKRGGDWQRVSLTDACHVTAEDEVDVEALDAALRRLAELDQRAARVVELRFFGGLTEPEVAKELGVSERTVRNDWSMARAWLRTALSQSGGEGMP